MDTIKCVIETTDPRLSLVHVVYHSFEFSVSRIFTDVMNRQQHQGSQGSQCSLLIGDRMKLGYLSKFDSFEK